VDTKYVGWVKGPKGKVVQDIQVKSATRIDVDQNTRDMDFASVKVFGTQEGVRLARALIATELAKITPELASQLVADFPGGLEAAQQEARWTGHSSACASSHSQVYSQPAQPSMHAQSVTGVFGQPDLSGLAALGNMGLAGASTSQGQVQSELPLWNGQAAGQGTGYGQDGSFANEEPRDYAMQQGLNPMMQSMLGLVAQQAMQPNMPQMQSMQSMQQQQQQQLQQPQQGGADPTAAAMQLANSLQQLAAAVSQATGQ